MQVSREIVLAHVSEERDRQDAKWGEQNHDDGYWLGILMEEVGEAAKAYIESKPKEVEAEIEQTAAVCVAWLECIRRREGVR